MARGDGKARKGHTKASRPAPKPRYTKDGTRKMAFGGNPGDLATGGFGTGNIGSGRSTSSTSGGLGASTREGGFAGASSSGGGGGGNINDMRSPVSNAARDDYLRDIDRASVRLGQNPAQAMVDAGVNPTVANLAAQRISAAEKNRLATFNRDGSITYSDVPASSKAKQFYDRIVPEEPVRQLPVRPISYTPAPRPAAPAAPATSPMSVYGNAFSFTPDEITSSLKSMYWEGLPGASYSQLTGLQKAMKSPENRAMAAAISAPFSNRTRAPMAAPPAPAGGLPSQNAPFQSGKGSPPVKSIVDRIAPDATYSSKYQDRLLSGPVAAPVYSPPSGAKAPTPAVQPPSKPLTAPPSVVGGRVNFGPAKSPLDSFRDRDLNRNRDRPRRRRPIVEEVETLKSGGVVRRDGAAMRGKTKGRYI